MERLWYKAVGLAAAPGPTLKPELFQMIGNDTPQKIPVAIEDEMRSSFMDYAMSVIVARALPDARDGLKPVHRRILFAQHEVNNVWNRPYVKCARIVGDVLGKYHPHGDAATYDALVRMAQDFAMRYPLIDGQGNFGSIDGDPPAAYRYTECRMARLASDLLADIGKDTVDHKPNYDDKEMEPVVLPARLPNLLLNGATGIAVGMATNIPPHNLGELIDAVMALIRRPDIGFRELYEIVPGPDFPTGGIIHGRAGIMQAYQTGRGSIVVRGRSTVEPMKGNRSQIVVTEMPFQVNKARWLEQTADLVREKTLEGISDLRDESSREGIRVVIELKRDAMPEVVLNNLYRMTSLQTSFSVNMLAIVAGRPRLLTLKDALVHFIAHRREVVTRRTVYELREAKSRKELVEGLGLAVLSIDRVIEIIRTSRDTEQASARLQLEPLIGLDGFLERAGRPADEVDAARTAGVYRLNQRQTQAILDMRLARLTGLERDKLEAEYRELCVEIDRLAGILGDDAVLLAVIVAELEEARAQYADPRRTELLDAGAEITDESLIAAEEMVVTVTHQGYVKRTPLTEYRAQARGGRGVRGAEHSDEDFVTEMFAASTHDHLLLFTDRGRVYTKRVFELPPGRREARGRALTNVIDLQPGEKVVTMLPVKTFDPGWFLFFSTRSGTVKKTELDLFSNIRANGLKAVGLDDDDALVAVRLTNGEMDVLLGTQNGYAIRFREVHARPMGRDARGVRGISLRDGDCVVGMAVFPREAAGSVLTVCERGFGKRTAMSEYPTKNRGGKGVITIRATARNGKVVAIRAVEADDHMILITDHGKLIRVPVGGVSVVGRATQGVRIMRVDDGENVTSVERLADPDDADLLAAEAVPEALEGAATEQHGIPVAISEDNDRTVAELLPGDDDGDSDGDDDGDSDGDDDGDSGDTGDDDDDDDDGDDDDDDDSDEPKDKA